MKQKRRGKVSVFPTRLLPTDGAFNHSFSPTPKRFCNLLFLFASRTCSQKNIKAWNLGRDHDKAQSLPSWEAIFNGLILHFQVLSKIAHTRKAAKSGVQGLRLDVPNRRWTCFWNSGILWKAIDVCEYQNCILVWQGVVVWCLLTQQKVLLEATKAGGVSLIHKEGVQILQVWIHCQEVDTTNGL